MENHGRSAEGSDSEVLSRLMGVEGDEEPWVPFMQSGLVPKVLKLGSTQSVPGMEQSPVSLEWGEQIREMRVKEQGQITRGRTSS